MKGAPLDPFRLELTVRGLPVFYLEVLRDNKGVVVGPMLPESEGVHAHFVIDPEGYRFKSQLTNQQRVEGPHSGLGDIEGGSVASIESEIGSLRTTYRDEDTCLVPLQAETGQAGPERVSRLPCEMIVSWLNPGVKTGDADYRRVPIRSLLSRRNAVGLVELGTGTLAIVAPMNEKEMIRFPLDRLFGQMRQFRDLLGMDAFFEIIQRRVKPSEVGGDAATTRTETERNGES